MAAPAIGAAYWDRHLFTKKQGISYVELESWDVASYTQPALMQLSHATDRKDQYLPLPRPLHYSIYCCHRFCYHNNVLHLSLHYYGQFTLYHYTQISHVHTHRPFGICSLFPSKQMNISCTHMYIN
jgi:hypothetical protein